MRAKDLLEAAEKGDNTFLDELRKSVTRKSRCQTVPETLDGKTTPEEILERFKFI